MQSRIIKCCFLAPSKSTGVVVNDITKRNNEKQNIEGDGCQVPLTVEDGLLSLTIFKPAMEERMNCVQITLISDELWDIGDDGDAKISIVLHETSNVPVIQDAIENIVAISKAKLYPSKSIFVIQVGKQIQS